MFFEAVLIPMYLIIGIWGGPRRVYAAVKFFLFTLTGSVLMLLALIAMWLQAGTTDISVLMETQFPAHMQTWLFFALFASFAVKVPMWPFHTWLPDAHVEAPTAGSVILAGVLLKMGAYGVLRFSVPMLPDAAQHFAPFIFTLSPRPLSAAPAWIMVMVTTLASCASNWRVTRVCSAVTISHATGTGSRV